MNTGSELRPKDPSSTAMMCLWNDIDAEIEHDYEAWYQRDHLRDRVNIPGFRNCRRYVRMAGEGRQYLTFSDLDSIDVTRSPPYLDRLAHATDWTCRIMPHFRRIIRVVADVNIDRGDGTGGLIATAAYEKVDERRRVAARRALDAALAEVMNDARVTRVRVLERNPASTDVPNPEAKLRPDPTQSAELAILLEGTYEAAVTRHLATLQALPELASLRPVVPPTVYRLLFTSRN
jgi:hypothetical protein